MTDTIHPALTTGEWKSLSTCGEEPYDDTIKDDWCHRTNGKVFISTVELTRRHAVAALCLYDQSYGFTREELKALQMTLNAALITADIEQYGIPDVRALAESAIAKINALLPPDPSP